MATTLYLWRVVKDGPDPGPATRVGQLLPSLMTEETARLREKATGELLEKVANPGEVFGDIADGPPGTPKGD